MKTTSQFKEKKNFECGFLSLHEVVNTKGQRKLFYFISLVMDINGFQRRHKETTESF